MIDRIIYASAVVLILLTIYNYLPFNYIPLHHP